MWPLIALALLAVGILLLLDAVTEAAVDAARVDHRRRWIKDHNHGKWGDIGDVVMRGYEGDDE